MSEYRRQLLTGVVLAILLSALFAFELESYFSPAKSNEPSLAKSSSIDTDLGLNFTLTAKPSSLQEGDNVTIGVYLFNILPSTNNLTSPTSNLYSLGPCPTTLPFWFEVIQGNYEADNMSQGQPLALWQAYPYCANSIPVQNYSFEVRSDNVTVALATTTLGEKQVIFSESASYIDSYFGSWGVLTHPDSRFALFQPGEYTVAAGDSWGQEDILHFRVVATRTSP